MFYFVSSFSFLWIQTVVRISRRWLLPQTSLRSPSSGVPGCPIQYPDSASPEEHRRHCPSRAERAAWDRFGAIVRPIPLKSFGKTGIQISALGLGGHHLGAAKDEQTAVEIVHRAVDGGITFFDCCWEYNRGKSEDWLGKGVQGSFGTRFF